MKIKLKANAIAPIVAVFGGLVVLAMLVVIGLTIAGTAWQTNYATIQALSDTNSKTAINSSVTSVFQSFSTSTTFIPLIVLAVIGGLALYYVMGFMGGGKGAVGGAM